tara:strand:+ start:1674 stop:1919 length:246 start_codon:yes stop_codon:yes gene_type:complete
MKYFLVFNLLAVLSLPNLASGNVATASGSLKDECEKTFKEVEDMFMYHNTLEVLGNPWGEKLDRATNFLDWCVKHELIKIK